MKYLKFLLPFSILILFYPKIGTGQNNVCLTIEANPNPSDPALGVFTKYVNVFGIGIYAESGMSDLKVKHVAAIMAEWLDNNEDGIIDNQVVLDALLAKSTLVPVFTTENSSAANTFFDNYNGNGVAAPLYNNEIITTYPLTGQFDATLEENMHAISSLGFADVYPSAFAEGPNSNSLLTVAMDAARGGHFINIPNPYPAGAWYHYDDNTCNYNCMTTEYFYWALTSKLGIQDYGNRCSEIAGEWEACTSAQFASMDALASALFSDASYILPTSAPDGNYCASALPVRFERFTAKEKDSKVILKWTTSSEVNNRGFEIEKKETKDNIWTSIGFVEANYNSNNIKTYSFQDESPDFGDNYYRIKQIDIDGRFSSSDVKSVRFTRNSIEMIIYPNPAQESFVISSLDKRNSMVNIAIYTVNGRCVYKNVALNLNEKVHIGDWQNGIYIIQLIHEQGKENHKLVVNK